MTEGTFKFELVSPEKILASEPVTLAIIPGEDGEFGVLVNHAPLLSSLKPGVVTLTTEQGETKRIFVAGGFADVTPGQCTVLAERAVNVDELDAAVLEQKISDLAEDMDLAAGDALKKSHIAAEREIVKAQLQAVTGRLVA